MFEYLADDLGQAWAEDIVARGGKVVRVTYPRTANNDKELTVVKGEYLEVNIQNALCFKRFSWYIFKLTIFRTHFKFTLSDEGAFIKHLYFN